MLCTIYFLLLFFYLLYRIYEIREKVLLNIHQRKSGMLLYFVDDSELILFTFMIPNFICYTFSRGIHIQFLLWISFSLPYLFLKAAQLPWFLAVGLYVVFDWCHSWTANVIQLKFLVAAWNLLLRGQFFSALEVSFGKKKYLSPSWN